MDTIGIQPGGRTIEQLKLAIRSIEGTRIRSKFALENAEGTHMKSRERGYGLYREYVFCDELMPDNETVANKNFLWLAEWYLQNINSLYCSPIDHVLWQQLDEKSPIASAIGEIESTEIQELYRQSDPENELVCQFHALWSNDDAYRPTTAERSLARDILAKYSPQQAEKLLPSVVEIMREHFPKAKSFGATRRYWFDAEEKSRREQTAAERRKQEFVEHELEDAKAQQDKANLKCWQVRWDQLPPSKQEEIRAHVLSVSSPRLHLEKYPGTLHRLCLRELGKQEELSAAA